MLITQSQSRQKENSPSCTVREYDFYKKNLGFALAKINGRFPDTGRSMNKECDELYYVISGSGTINYDGDEYELNEGDAFYIEAGKPYRVQGVELTLALPTQPARSPDQREAVE